MMGMTHAGRRIARLLLTAACIGAPALAATPPSATDPGLESTPLDMARHAMPPPEEVSAPAAGKPAAASSKPAAPPAVSANPLWAVPLSSLTATRERPLFSPSRRPPAPAVASAPALAPVRPPPPPPVPQHPNLTLVGTVAGSSESIAVFLDSATHAAVRLRTGEGHNGWVLESVGGRTATLRKNETSETLELPRPVMRAGSAPAVSGLPPAVLPPPVIPAAAAPTPPPPSSGAPGTTNQLGGCLPEPIGC